jgi:RNA polymerase sigma-70 factor (ECF subfamily)
MRVSSSDQELIISYQSGNELAFETLLNRYQQQVYSKIQFMVRDTEVANDIFQETFIKVVNTLKSGKYSHQGKFLSWALRIAHNQCIDHFRRGKKMPMVRKKEEYDVFDTLAQQDPHIEDQLVQDQILSDVRNLIDHLPEEQQVVVRMRIYQDLSFQESADRTDVSINTALGRMRYALINLRGLVDTHGIQLTAI